MVCPVANLFRSFSLHCVTISFVDYSIKFKNLPQQDFLELRKFQKFDLLGEFLQNTQTH